MINNIQAKSAADQLRGGWGEAVSWHASLGSTSTEAASLLRQTPAPAGGMLVVAQRQTAGRGRGRNAWFSDEGSLTFSLLTPPVELDRDALPQASLAVGVAICEALDEVTDGAATAACVGLKWPNDLYAGGKKLGGVLIESPGFGPRRLVVGVGLNVATELDRLPDRVRSRSTSLAELVDSPVDPAALLVASVQRIEDRLERLIAGDTNLCQQWQARSILSGKQTVIDTAAGPLRGVCRGIDQRGRLLLETPQGTQRLVSGSVVSFA